LEDCADQRAEFMSLVRIHLPSVGQATAEVAAESTPRTTVDSWDGARVEVDTASSHRTLARRSETASPWSRRLGGLMGSMMLHLGAIAVLAQTSSMVRQWELRLPAGRNSVALAASVSSPPAEAGPPPKFELESTATPQTRPNRTEPEMPMPTPTAAIELLPSDRKSPPPEIPPVTPAGVEEVEVAAMPTPPVASRPKSSAEVRLRPAELSVPQESVASTASAASGGAQTLTPSVVHRVSPQYPPAALSAGIQGLVKLRVRVDDQGRVVEADVAQSSGHPLLDRAALDVIYEWQFTSPDGARGVAAEFVTPIEFRLRR